MQILTLNQVAFVSGGCAQAVANYESSTQVNSALFSLAGMGAGFALGMTVHPAAAIMGGAVGILAGDHLGYAMGALNYHAGRYVHQGVNWALKPAGDVAAPVAA